MTELTPAQRSDLRARAHHLNPVVTIAGNGLTPNVLAEIERALDAHELIKVKVQGSDREQRDALMQTLCETVAAAPVQHIGSILIVWRERRESEKPAAAGEKKTARPATAKSAAAFAAAARRAALAKASSESRRSPARAPAVRGRSSSGNRGR